MALEYLKVFGEIEEYVEELTDDQLGRVFSAMMAYAFRDEEPDFERGTAERYVWPAIRNKIDGCERKVRQKRENGEKGGRPRKNENKENPEETENIQTEPNKTKENQTEQNKTSNEHEHVQEQEHEHVQEQEQRESNSARARKRAAPFTPPSPDEVAAYCRERGNAVDAERFCDFYASKGWMIGNQRMKDWRAAVRTWEKREETQAAQRAAPGEKRTDHMLRYTKEQRKATYSAAILDFDGEEKP